MFHKLRVLKNFMIKWVMSRSSVEFFFCLAVPKTFVEETLLRFTKLLVSKKFVDMWGWSKYHIFRSNFFCLTAPKNFIKKPSTVALVSGIENFYDTRGYVTISCRFFCLAVAKKFVEETFCAVFQDTSVSEKVYV